ncbi:interference hedgehog-like isoform X2 [Danaus plexippus]|uniref:interference hedgehog-like isoform X2 n=1 Tax=Danaus plexippus TaxID=13037 RepID=UPI002AB0E46F|nr:interference hedgehog-like isoform X2 [Danaus plexippus]
MGLRVLLQMLWIACVLGEIDIRFTKHPESVSAPVGDEVSFECAVRVPGERLAWRWRYDSPNWTDWTDLNGFNDKDGVSTRLVVKIKEDTATTYYQCVVWYGAISLVSTPARLSVAKLDLSRNSPEKRVITAPLYNTVVIHCREPSSEPPARLSWWKETKGSRRTIDSPYGVLVIKNATAEDSGTYGCTATNDISEQVVDLPERVYLRVQHEGNGGYRFLESEDYAGTMQDGVLTASVPSGGIFRVWCDAVGSPPPHVRWTGPNGVIEANHELVIERFDEKNEGVYTCSANDIRRSWKVIALRPPQWEGSAASVNASEGSPALISCGIPRGQPPPTVHWIHNAEPINTGPGVLATETSLRLDHVEKRHAGVVQCAACGGGRCALDAALLSVVPVQVNDPDYSSEVTKTMHVPSQQPKRHNKKNPRKHKAVLIPPSRPNVSRLSDESVMVSWSHDNHGLPIQFFKVQYKEATNSSNVQWQTANHDIPAHIHSFEIDGLIPDKYYKFRIAAVYSNQDNKLGRSSGRFFLQRGSSQAPRRPVLDNAVALSPHSIQLNWTMPPDGVAPEGFYVYYRAVSTAGAYEKVIAGGSTRSLMLEHLSPDTAYELKIQAYISNAPSDFSAILNAKTLRGPAPPSPEPAPPPASPPRAPSALVTAGGAGAAVLLLLLAALVLMCRRRRPATKKGSVPEGSNGYRPAKVPISITTNPMHTEGSEPGVEMSFLHNNNCGNNTDGDEAHSRKNGPSRQYV